jgi:drug/metabolite transporter (DMT)-like permease
MMQLPETWLILSIAGPMILAIANIIDKAVISSVVKNPFIVMLFSGAIALTAGIGFTVYSGVDTTTAPYGILTGLMFGIGMILYFYTMSKEEASRVVSIISITPLAVLLMASAFLGEKFGTETYVGIASVVIGAFLISVKRSTFKGLSFRKPLLLLMVAPLFVATGDIVAKGYSDESNFISFFGWTSVGQSIPLFSCVLLVPRFRKQLSGIWKLKGNSMGIITTSEILTVIAHFSVITAISFGPVSLVSAVFSSQPMFTLLYAFLFSMWRPKLLKEHTDGGSMASKAISITLIVAGVATISYFN